MSDRYMRFLDRNMGFLLGILVVILLVLFGLT